MESPRVSLSRLLAWGLLGGFLAVVMSFGLLLVYGWAKGWGRRPRRHDVLGRHMTSVLFCVLPVFAVLGAVLGGFVAFKTAGQRNRDSKLDQVEPNAPPDRRDV